MSRYNIVRHCFFWSIIGLITIRTYTSFTRYGFMFYEGWGEMRVHFTLISQMYEKYSVNKVSFLLHTYLGFLYSILLAFQVYPREKIKSITFHKIRGWLVLILLHLVIGIAFSLSFKNSMFGSKQASFLGTIWTILLVYTVLGFKALSKKDYYNHSRWMRRLAILSMGPSGQILFINVIYMVGLPVSYLEVFTEYSANFGYYSLILFGEVLLYLEKRSLRSE